MLYKKMYKNYINSLKKKISKELKDILYEYFFVEINTDTQFNSWNEWNS